MILVVDASVAVKWFFQGLVEEQHEEKALRLLHALSQGSVRFLQPPHFIAEVASVLARKKPRNAGDDLMDLLSLDFAQANDPRIHLLACELSIKLDHHLFDTLYHAVALLEPGARLITADMKYYEKAQALGGVMPLSEARF